MTFSDVIIIGNGLFGQIIAHELISRGRQVVILDREEAEAGSRPAACLMKPSWFSSLGSDVYDPALELLDRHFGVKDIQFSVGPAKLGGVHWVDPRVVMTLKANHCNVTSVGDKEVVTDIGIFQANLIVVAAGVWSSELVPVPGLVGRAGVAFTWETPDCFNFEPFIKPWAPYRQLVAFKRGENELWMGDGSAIKPENWTPAHRERSLDRCINALGEVDEGFRGRAKTHYGIRPYVPKVKPCYLEQVTNHLWVATGGAKNGTIAAAWCAHKIAEATC